MNIENVKNISNLKVSVSCYKELKKVSIDEDLTLQEVAQKILEKAMSKKKQKDQQEEK